MTAPVSQAWDDVLVSRHHNDALHLMPVDDHIEHDTSTTCPCGPHVEPLGKIDLLVAHFALDGRPD